MTIWLNRAGSNGEYENKFISDSKIYLTWDELKCDLSKIKDRDGIKNLLENTYPDYPIRKISNYASQILSFITNMQINDWVALPSKFNSTIHFGKIKGDYRYDPSGGEYLHFREVQWFAKNVARSCFDQDILFSLGAFSTICKIQNNNAEDRIKNLYKNNWQRTSQNKNLLVTDANGDDQQIINLEESATDQIAEYIIQKFKGNRMAILIEAILKVQGFFTYRSPDGPDKGVDILASKEDDLGFSSPRVCVQVKSGNDLVDRLTLDQLIGTMDNFKADHGLLVSWSGFKNSVAREEAGHFFKVRLWDSKDIIEQLTKYYDSLDDKIKAEIPLKRVWTLTLNE